MGPFQHQRLIKLIAPVHKGNSKQRTYLHVAACFTPHTQMAPLTAPRPRRRRFLWRAGEKARVRRSI